MSRERTDIGYAQTIEEIYSLAGKLGRDIKQETLDEFGVIPERLDPDHAQAVRNELREQLKKGDKAMSQAPTRPEVPTDAASTNFFWSYGGKEGKEVYNLQTTIRGILTDEEIEAHVKSAMKAMAAVFRHGGHAKPVGQQAPATEPTPAAKNGHAKEIGEPWEMTSRKGKMLVIVKHGDPPAQVECPIHKAPMKFKEGEYGPNYFHKAPDGQWCRANVETA